MTQFNFIYGPQTLSRSSVFQTSGPAGYHTWANKAFKKLGQEKPQISRFMSTIALHRPHFSSTSRYGVRDYRKLQRFTSCWTVLSSKSTAAARKGKEYLSEPQKLSIPEINKLSSSNIKFDRLQLGLVGVEAEYGEFVAREAQLDEEYYWTAAWLRAETLWEDREHERYAENYRRQFAQQEFNSMTKRYNTQRGDKCKCIVMVKKEDRRSLLKSVVGTLDLSIRYFYHGETFPGEQEQERVKLKPPLFCLIERKASSSYGYIANLCVAKSARQQGIASSMLHYAILSAKAHGAVQVFVHVHKNNKPAQGLYQKMGFQLKNWKIIEFYAHNSRLSMQQPLNSLPIKRTCYVLRLQAT